MDRELFQQMYDAGAPWDTGRPQPVFVKLDEAGQIRGRVLDVGCGTGENALYFASKGHEVLGIDFVPGAIEQARAKSTSRGVAAQFKVGDALELGKHAQKFQTIVDCGLFHTFSDQERPAFVRGLADVLQSGGLLHILCFSEDEPGTEGPRRVRQAEIHAAFAAGWRVARIEASRFDITPASARMFSPGGPKAWLATIERV